MLSSAAMPEPEALVFWQYW